MKIKIKYFNKKFIRRHSIGLVLSIMGTCLLNGGFPHDSKNDNTKEYNFKQVVAYGEKDYTLSFDFPVTDEYVRKITSDEHRSEYGKLERIKFSKNYFVTDLSSFENVYDEITHLEIDRCPSIIDLNPIYNMKNLKYLFIYESGSVSKELINYLDEHGIVHNLSEEDVEIQGILQKIIDQVTNESMSSIEKIKAVCFYLVNNYCYDKNSSSESNQYPLTFFLKKGKGVCVSYAYVANLLFNMIGIESYTIRSDNHAWVLVKVGDYYYYVDPTNIDKNDFINKMFIQYFNIGDGFMTDPGENNNITTVNYFENSDKIIMPASLAMKIEESENKKNIFERNSLQTKNYIKYFVLLYIVQYFLQLSVEKMKNIKKLDEEIKIKKKK